jgi:hypothetical protein
MANLLLARSGLIDFGLVSPDERQKNTSTGTKKLAGLENTLRDGTEQQQAVINAPKSTENATARHSAMKNKLRQKDNIIHRYNSELADYGSQLEQMTNLYTEAGRALDLSSLQNKDLLKLEGMNNRHLLSTQTGLFNISKSNARKAKTRNKLANQTQL